MTRDDYWERRLEKRCVKCGAQDAKPSQGGVGVISAVRS